MTFSLHPQLAGDTAPVCDLPLSAALLMNDARFPWIILVPRVPNVRDLVDLNHSDQIVLLDEINRTCQTLKMLFTPDKLNVASLGNMVPQLHVHIIARHTTDAAWPAPVWGAGTIKPYDESTRASRLAALASELAHTA